MDLCLGTFGKDLTKRGGRGKSRRHSLFEQNL